MTTGTKVGRGVRAKPGQAKAWQRKAREAIEREPPPSENKTTSPSDAFKSNSPANPRPDDDRAILIHALRTIWGACDRHSKLEGHGCRCACVLAREALQLVGEEPLSPAWRQYLEQSQEVAARRRTKNAQS